MYLINDTFLCVCFLFVIIIALQKNTNRKNDKKITPVPKLAAREHGVISTQRIGIFGESSSWQ